MVDIQNTWEIQKGNTLWGIAKKNGTTVDELLKLNPNLKGHERNIKIGTVIKLPAASRVGTTVEKIAPKPSDKLEAQKRNKAHQKAVAEMQATAAATRQNNSNSATKELSHDKPLPVKASEDTLNMVQKEMQVKAVPAGNPRYRSAEEWSNLIEKISTKYNMPKEILNAHISKEVTFRKNLVSNGQYGCMQITRSVTNSMFPGSKNNWSDVYEELDPKLYHDIMYKRDAKGNIVPKYINSLAMLRACKDDETSLKVGTLYDKLTYAWSVALKRYGVRNKRGKLVVSHENIIKTIRELKQKPVTPQENLNNIKAMATKYNGSSSYGIAILDSIKRMKFNPEQNMFIRKS